MTRIRLFEVKHLIFIPLLPEQVMGLIEVSNKSSRSPFSAAKSIVWCGNSRFERFSIGGSRNDRKLSNIYLLCALNPSERLVLAALYDATCDAPLISAHMRAVLPRCQVSLARHDRDGQRQALPPASQSKLDLMLLTMQFVVSSEQPHL